MPLPSNQIASKQSNSKISLFTLGGISIVALQVILEVSKQVSNYSMQYYNGGKYVIASSALVVTTEILKILFTLLRMGSWPIMNAETFKSSLKYVIPSLLYAVNNNIYFFGLTLVPPPIWLILCSMRTLVTAFIYRVFLKREINYLQYLGIACIVSSLVIAKIPDVMYYSVNKVPFTAISLALVASCLSALAAIYTELLFKSKSASNSSSESFLVKQFWLYFYGIIVSTLLHIASNPSYSIITFRNDIVDMNPYTLGAFIVALACGSIGGLTVASILKYLDNIVKEYSGSFANVLTAILSSFLFPEKFQFTLFIVFSLVSLIIGILLYETKKKSPKGN
eukprot:TRINITY_DN2302_c0_g1_i1.p1 TRINITY_DN2302_c0_g1~~TRINITY_DN2302_c0_g1_i1.p1  ORF type:complete len:338 (-),score=29.17 TRINITY_DN2302_c0_g1_i1:196-1209(-)